jgi:hypothetical protein
MKGKSFLIKILIIGGAIILLFILGLYLTLKTKKKDLATQFPFVQLIGTEHAINNFCYIAKNYEHYVNKNPCLLKFTNKFDSKACEAYEIQIGTRLNFIGAKALTNGTSGLTTSNKAFNKILSGIWNTNKYMGNQDFENTTFEKNRYEVDMKFYAKPFYQITPQNYALLQLNKVYLD